MPIDLEAGVVRREFGVSDIEDVESAMGVPVPGVSLRLVTIRT